MPPGQRWPRAAKNADIVAYAPDTLKSAQDKLAQMETELTAKHYDKVKALALDAKATAGPRQTTRPGARRRRRQTPRR